MDRSPVFDTFGSALHNLMCCRDPADDVEYCILKKDHVHKYQDLIDRNKLQRKDFELELGMGPYLQRKLHHLSRNKQKHGIMNKYFLFRIFRHRMWM